MNRRSLSIGNRNKNDSINGASKVVSGGSDSILAAVFGDIKYLVAPTTDRWNQFMTAYLRDPKNGIAKNMKDQSSARGNLAKELLKNKMTWKVFCKGLRFLNIVSFEFVIRVKHKNGIITEHSRQISLASPLDMPDANPNQKGND